MLRIITFCALFLLAASVSATINHVKKGGSDAADGSSWANAWETISKVNSSAGAGDTTLFGTGRWYGTELVVVSGSGEGSESVYGCSTFTAADPTTGDYNLSEISGMTDSLTGWTQVGATNQYKKASTPANLDNLQSVIWQGDSAMERMVYRDSVDVEPGRFYVDADSIVMYAYDLGSGYDPDSYPIYWSYGTGCIRADSVSYVIVWGFDLTFSYGKAVTMGAGNYGSLYVSIEHCRIRNVIGRGGNNPSGVYSDSHASPGQSRYNKVRACSVTNVWAFFESGGEPYDTADFRWETSHGSGVTFYSQMYVTVDSSYFYGYFSYGGTYHKNDNGYDDSGGVWAFNTYETSGRNSMMFFRRLINVKIYGNIFIGGRTAIHLFYSNGASGPFEILNNTFYEFSNGAVLTHDEEGGGPTPHTGITFKYNLIYVSSPQVVDFTFASYDHSNPSNITADSNQFYDSAGVFVRTGQYGTEDIHTITEWIAHTWEANSWWDVDPVFADTAARDFTPSNAMPINVTHNGKVWGSGGATQAAVAEGVSTEIKEATLSGGVTVN